MIRYGITGEVGHQRVGERDIMDERLTMNVTKVINHYGNPIVMANVDGNYDKGGLPEQYSPSI
jgi:hypothetical protein